MAIARKKKKCIQCGKMRLIWSHGRCSHCAARASALVNMEMKKEQHKADLDLYMDKWLHRLEDRCEACGAMIFEPQTFNFHHLLEKSKYPLLRYDPDNIAIVCWQCHDQIHRMSGRITCFDNRIAELKQMIEN